MADSGKKDTVYVDIDDEITGIIDKVRASDEKIVALVLPKRATVLQSIVNMKLLKRSADAEKKHLVLITSEAGLMPLAGTVGLYVAKNLQSKPEIPLVAGEAAEDVAEEPLTFDDDEPTDQDVTAENDGHRSVGELAAAGAAGAAAGEGIETLELGDDDEPDAAETAAAAPAAKKAGKKLRIPNFNKFRLRLFLGVLVLLLLIFGWYVAAAVLPKANVVITTDSDDINSNLTLNLNTKADTLQPDSLTVPAQVQQVKKDDSQQVDTTGQQNNGNKAAGSVTMSACSLTPVADVPAGTGISTGGNTYITQTTASFGNTGHFNNGCWEQQSGSVNITAQQAGAKYNVSGANFSVAGRSEVSASGSASGGTDDIVQVVSQADIDSATKQIEKQDTDAIKQQLRQQLQQSGLYPIDATFDTGTPKVSSSSEVGDQAKTVTVSETITYTMFGVKQDDLKQLVDNDIKDQIDTSKQTILSEGLDNASFRAIAVSGSTAQVAMSTTAVAGPDLHVDSLKQQLAGKKSGDVKSMLKSTPGVTDVQVHLSPFWVTSVPKKTSKITITFQKAAATSNNANSN